MQVDNQQFALIVDKILQARTPRATDTSLQFMLLNGQ